MTELLHICHHCGQPILPQEPAGYYNPDGRTAGWWHQRCVPLAEASGLYHSFGFGNRPCPPAAAPTPAPIRGRRAAAIAAWQAAHSEADGQARMHFSEPREREDAA
ncbi:MAG: hypothetical protein ACRC56_11970 [Bosea sp. (in: a-proteobacteria)]